MFYTVFFSLANASDSPDQSVNNSGDEGRLSPNMPTMNHTDSETQQNKSLELENQLLKNEITSLNHEMTSVIARARESQDGRFMVHYILGFLWDVCTHCNCPIN